MTRRNRKHQIPAWMANYYANSVGGAVIDSYRTGRVVTVDADRRSTDEKTTRENAEIRQAEADLRVVESEIDEAYWLFSRSTSRGPGRLADADLYARRNAARERLLDLRRGLMESEDRKAYNDKVQEELRLGPEKGTREQENKAIRESLDANYPGGAKQALANLRKMMVEEAA